MPTLTRSTHSVAWSRENRHDVFDVVVYPAGAGIVMEVQLDGPRIAVGVVVKPGADPIWSMSVLNYADGAALLAAMTFVNRLADVFGCVVHAHLRRGVAVAEAVDLLCPAGTEPVILAALELAADWFML